MKTIEEITRLIERYPLKWRRWCDAPERGGCACLGCLRQPAPSTVRGDPEGQPFPNPADRLTREEVELWEAAGNTTKDRGFDNVGWALSDTAHFDPGRINVLAQDNNFTVAWTLRKSSLATPGEWTIVADNAQIFGPPEGCYVMTIGDTQFAAKSSEECHRLARILLGVAPSLSPQEKPDG